METCLECVPCLVRQTFESTAFITDNNSAREDIMRIALGMLESMDFSHSPPYMAALIHRMIREKSGCADPYKEVKEKFNNIALELYPMMEEKLLNSEDRFETAVRLAITGNIIDFGVPLRPDEDGLPRMIDEAMSHHLHGGGLEKMRKCAEEAESILVLGDNTGEIVFDKFLIEQLSPDKCTYAVKGSPIINDSTLEDARAVGMDKLVKVIDNGSDAPGTIIEWCRPDFVELFTSADMIVSKGQGNYETLSLAERGNVFFLLRAKCPVIAQDLNCELGSYVVVEHERA